MRDCMAFSPAFSLENQAAGSPALPPGGACLREDLF